MLPAMRIISSSVRSSLQVSDASLHCALQLFFSLVSTMGMMNTALVDKILGSMEEMLVNLPLFSLSETSACRPAHLTDSVLDDLHVFLMQLVGEVVRVLVLLLQRGGEGGFNAVPAGTEVVG